MSTLASPFGWEVGPLGLGGGELACGVVWPCAFGAVLFAWCVGLGGEVGGQSRIESEFPPSVRLTPATFPQRGRLFRAPALQSLCSLAFYINTSMVHTISLALWGEVAPVRVSERGSSLAGLYGLACVVRVSCVVSWVWWRGWKAV